PPRPTLFPYTTLFRSLGRDSESDFFGDALAEEIASQLGQVHDLKVIAHTSALQFKGRPDPPRAIGEALGVTTLLEGSVLVAGARSEEHTSELQSPYDL